MLPWDEAVSQGLCRPSFYKSLLYIRLDGIGDNILSAPLLENMPGVFPNAAITVVCDKSAAALYEHAPMAGKIVPLDKKRLREPEYFREALETLRQCRADVVFSGALSPTAHDCALMLETGLPVISTEVDTSNMPHADKTAFEQKAAVLLPRRRSARMEVERHGDILETLGVTGVSLSPKMWLSGEDFRDAEACWKACGFSPEKTVALFAGGGQPGNRYPWFGEALAGFFAENGYAVAALGGPGDRKVNDAVLTAFADRGVPVANLCAEKSLRRDAAFLRDCRLAFGVDTALAHIACVSGTPLVTLVSGPFFGRFLPYSSNTTVVCLPLACYGCRWKCRYETPHCITGIAPETVRQAVEHVLSRPRGSERKTLFMQSPDRWPGREGGPDWQSPQAFIAAHKSKKIGGLSVVVGR